MRISHVLATLLLVGSLGLCGAAKAQSAAHEGYYGVVSKSDSHKVGSSFTFANLLSDRPFVTYPSGHGEQSAKVFEDGDLIVPLFVAHLTGSTEIFYIAKNALSSPLLKLEP